MFAALALAVCAVLPAQAQVTGDAKAGAGKVALCLGCHAIPGYHASFPEVYRVPMILGQNAPYIVAALNSYRKGERKHPTMRGVAGSLTDQDTADIAAYLEQLGHKDGAAALPTPRPADAPVAQLLQKGTCVSCHGENFSKPIDPAYPRLAGQHPDYLYMALRAYHDDTHQTWGRTHPIMGAMSKPFTNAELKAIAQYIGSLSGELQTIPASKLR
jgi:cytochrome c553